MVSVIVPAYNERYHVAEVLAEIQKKYDIIVVDDGSTDRTAEVVRDFGYKVIRLERNRGKAYACKIGIRASKSELNVFIDADGQLDPRELPKIIKHLKSCDLVLGQRDMRRLPWNKKLTNWLSRKAILIITGNEFPDVLCGFRGIRKSKFNKLDLKEEGYYFETDIIIEAMKNKLNIKSVSVNVSYETGSRMSWKSSTRLALHLIYKSFKHVLTGK